MAPLLVVSALPVLLARGLWAEVWRGLGSQAWDGSGHYALARVYSESVFPDTFGWTGAYFAGMGFPNFYPPLFYWLVALLYHTGLFPLAAAFKLILLVPVLLLPAALWLLAWRVSGRDSLAGACASLAAVPLLVDVRLTDSLGLMGLSYTSTFLIGLYTQPLGFVLLAAWYVLYTSEEFARRAWRVPLASAALALALLANFFSANLAALFVLTTAGHDLWRVVRADSPRAKGDAKRDLLARLASAAAGVGLTLFWLAPLMSSYAYVVTRPQRVPAGSLVSTPLLLWYALAAAGALLWMRRRTRRAYPYLLACAFMAAAVLGLGFVAPGWFPLHPPRLASTLNFLLAAPAGGALAAALRFIGSKAARGLRREDSGEAEKAGHTLNLGPRLGPRVAGAALLAGTALLMFWLIKPPPSGLAFYDEAEWARISPVLDFARGRREGRYLVENQPFADPEAAHDGRALSAYLGAQGNASSALFFREGSPNVLFLNPLADAFSRHPDSYGISSVLVDDADFSRRTLASHIARARFFGIKYLVIRTPAMKDRLVAEREIAARYDFGEWAVFETAGASPPAVRALQYRPALVVGELTLKLRRRNEYGFTRLAEEQFNSGWFDVILARSPGTRLDRLEVPEGFGSVVVEAYRYDDAERAYERLRAVARDRHLVLLAADDALFRRVRDSMQEFPQAQIIERPREGPGDWLDSDRPTRSYDDSAVRRVWGQLRRALDSRKVPAAAGVDTDLTGEVGPSSVAINSRAAQAGVPALIATTFHPNWRSEDGGEIYAATPFFMLTFVSGPASVVFERTWSDRAGLYASALTLLLLPLYTAWQWRRDLGRNRASHPKAEP